MQALLSLACFSLTAHADTLDYAFNTIPNGASGNFQAWGIGNNGTIVGNLYTGYGVYGATYSEGAVTSIPGYMQYAFDINSGGTVVGTNAYNGSKGYMRDSAGQTTFFDVTLPGAIQGTTWGSGINNSGQVVGFYTSNHYQGYLRNVDGSFVNISVPDATYTQARGINDSGYVVGNYSVALNDAYASVRAYGFVRAPNGTFTTLSGPNAIAGLGTYVTDINNNGDVLGWYYANQAGYSGAAVPFVYRDGKYFTVDLPSTMQGPSVQFTGLNDSRSFVGTANGGSFVAVLAPVPEPKTYAMMMAGLGLLGFMAKRKKSA